MRHRPRRRPQLSELTVADTHRLPRPVTDISDWQMRGACRDMDSEVFFYPESERGLAKTRREAHAKHICGSCPVLEQCRRYALAAQEPYGVWGGLTVVERVQILRGPDAQPDPARPRTPHAAAALVHDEQEQQIMGDFQACTTVNAAEQELFDDLSEVSNLPHYFTRMASAVPGDGEEVHTTATMPDGTTVGGGAWFRVDPTARLIEWGSEGPSDYHGSLEVGADADGGATVGVRLHTTRVPDGDPEVAAGLEDTVATIKRLVEHQHTLT